jgi:hypothetical protein
MRQNSASCRHVNSLMISARLSVPPESESTIYTSLFFQAYCRVQLSRW